MHDNDDIKERRAEMDIYYYKVLNTIYEII